jgi:hypothetical protein
MFPVRPGFFILSSSSGNIGREVRNSGEPRIDHDHRLAPAKQRKLAGALY